MNTVLEEERNFCRLVLLLLRVGVPCLRALFKTRWDSTGRTARTWTDSSQNGRELLRIFKPLSYERWQVKSGNTSTWDLSLAINVLVQSTPPFLSTPELVSALETLRGLRTRLCHANSPRIKANDFERLWTGTCHALTLLGTVFEKNFEKDFEKVKKDVQKPRRFLIPELRECAAQEREILLLLQSINSKQSQLLPTPRTKGPQTALREGQKTSTLEVNSTIQREQEQQELLDGRTAQLKHTQRSTLVMSQNQSSQLKIQKNQSIKYDKYVCFYITAKDSSHVAVGDDARVTTYADAPTGGHPANQTVNTTRKQIAEEFTRKLKSSIKQQTEDFLPRKDRKIRTDDIFTNLTIQRDPEHFARTEQTERSGRERKYEKKSRITLLKTCSEMFISPNQNDLNSKVTSSNPKSILLIGKAGIGKSLFCRKIVRDWADDKLFDKNIKLPDVQFAFLLTFRQLNSLRDEVLTLKEILKHSPILDERSVILDDVFGIISANSKKLLILLDGYDEYAYSSNIVGHFEENYQNDPNEKMPVPAWIAKLMKGKIWKDSVLLVTSRPSEASSLVGNLNVSFDVMVEIKGFSSSQVLDYVTKYFMHDEDMKNMVLGHISGNQNLVRFGHIPVMCYLMCYYMEWQIAHSETGTLPETRTDLYLKVIQLFIKGHHVDLKFKRKITENELQEIIYRLAEMAVKLTENKKFSFSEHDMKELGISQEDIASLKASGLLDCWPAFVKRSLDPFGEVSLEYTFTHLTIQEFLCAFFYVETKKIPEKNKTTGMTLVFVAEMVPRKRDKKLLKALLKAIEPEDVKDDTNRLLTLRCLQGFGDKEFATRRIADLYEKFCNTKGWVVFSGVTDMDCLSIAYFFGMVKSLYEEHGNRQLTKIFKKHFVAVNTLYILNSTLTPLGVRVICNSLINSTVTELELNCCGLEDTHCVEIIKGLSQSKVTTLNLPYNHITGESVTDICQVLEYENCHVLESVNLCGNRLNEECKKFLRCRLRKHKPNLRLVLD